MIRTAHETGMDDWQRTMSAVVLDFFIVYAGANTAATSGAECDARCHGCAESHAQASKQRIALRRRGANHRNGAGFAHRTGFDPDCLIAGTVGLRHLVHAHHHRALHAASCTWHARDAAEYGTHRSGLVSDLIYHVTGAANIKSECLRTVHGRQDINAASI